MKFLIYCALLVFVVLNVNVCGVIRFSTNELIVDLVTPKGKILGHTLQSFNGNEYYAFQEIPYAAPPVGNLRYQVPQSHKGWTGVLNCTNNTKVCPQPQSSYLDQDEDCLFVNVYTPVKPGSNIFLPVYVWIHGGGYAVWDGGFQRYNPSYLIDHNMVIVTLNYRLGALGFLATDDCVLPGNLGLRDQNFALKWVSENIHLFGGDSSKVTIGGESAGSSSVGSHILSKMSKGLFRGAIQESGSSISYYNFVPSPSVYAYKLAQILDNSINPQSTNTSELLDFLKKAEVTDIITASVQVSPLATGGMLLSDLIWAPTLEKNCTAEPFLSKPMHEAFINGDFNRVPLLIGFNSEEMLYFTPSSITTIAFKIPSWEVFNELAEHLDHNNEDIAHVELDVLDSKRAEVSEQIKHLYTNSSFLDDPYAFVRISSDLYFIQAIIRQAETSSKFIPVYMYEFDYTADDLFPFPGTQHTEELRYMWKNVEDLPFNNTFQPILQDRMCTLWSNFIIHQNPTPSRDSKLLNLVWPTVKPSSINYVNINKKFKIYSNPRQYLHIKNILLDYLQHPRIVY
ncbi:carboxylic ester hydrolase-like [Diabrotica undecimpunctata]|uniref:carboxylic ester hydrolase-like n=1 Tax=Diabrotica undecimpunctata TaxID=50387 RepID=UPI003B633D9F